MLCGNHTLRWYRACMVALINIITLDISCKVDGGFEIYLAAWSVGVRCGVVGDGSWGLLRTFCVLAVPLLFGVLGVTDFERWPLLLLLLLVVWRFLTGLSASLLPFVLGVELLRCCVTGVGILEVEEIVYFGVGVCVAILLILLFVVEF